jgi:hypothetical protein
MAITLTSLIISFPARPYLGRPQRLTGKVSGTKKGRRLTVTAFCVGDPGRTRTCNQGIKSALLCQLSYGARRAHLL